jgi:hypothetical protein
MRFWKVKTFDSRIVVPLDSDDDTILKTGMEAHKRDITLNQTVEQLLRNLIAENTYAAYVAEYFEKNRHLPEYEFGQACIWAGIIPYPFRHYR